MQCPGGCDRAQIWRRQLSGGIAVAFINLSSASVQEMCISQSALEPFDTATLLEVLIIMSCPYCRELGLSFCGKDYGSLEQII